MVIWYFETYWLFWIDMRFRFSFYLCFWHCKASQTRPRKSLFSKQLWSANFSLNENAQNQKHSPAALWKFSDCRTAGRWWHRALNSNFSCTLIRVFPQGIKEIERHIPFSRDSRLGYLTFCPTNLGTTIRASVHIKLPKLAANKARLEQVAAKYNLQVRG